VKPFLIAPLLLLALPVQASKFTIYSTADAPVYLRIGYGLLGKDDEHWIDCPVKSNFEAKGKAGENVRFVKYSLKPHDEDSLVEIASRRDLIIWARRNAPGTTADGHWLVYISNGPDGKPTATMDPEKFPEEVRKRFPFFKSTSKARLR